MFMFSKNHRQNNCATSAKHKKGWSCVAYLLQRFLHSTLVCFPTTAGSAQFCLLCCQPKPVPESLPARPPPLTRDALADYLFGKGNPSTWRAGRTPPHDTPSVKPPIRGTEQFNPPQMAHPMYARTAVTTTHKCKWCARTTNAKAQDGCMP